MKIEVTRYGDMMYLENDLYVGKSLQSYGEVDYYKVELFKKIVSKGDVFVDVGANIGQITVPMSKHVTDEGYVLALEAHTFLHFMLCGNIAMNHLMNVQCFNRAAKDVSSGVSYFPSFDINGEVDLNKIEIGNLLNAKDSLERKCDNPVACIAIDSMNLSRPKLINISVNGMELSVLNGSRKTIDKSTPLLYVDITNNQEEILKFMEDIGYDWLIHDYPKFNSNNYKKEIQQSNLGNSMSLFCYPKGSKPEISDEYLFDVNDSEKYKSLRDIKDHLSGQEFQTVS